MLSNLHTKMNLSIPHILLIALRLGQFALALTVCGLYGVDLNAARKEDKYTDSKWLFAEIIGAIAAVVSLFYMLPFRWVIEIPFAFVADALLFVLWIAVFGVFTELYIGTKTDSSGQTRMHHAVWIDLTNALLWAFTAAIMAMIWIRTRHNRSQFTGRARV